MSPRFQQHPRCLWASHPRKRGTCAIPSQHLHCLSVCPSCSVQRGPSPLHEGSPPHGEPRSSTAQNPVFGRTHSSQPEGSWYSSLHSLHLEGRDCVFLRHLEEGFRVKSVRIKAHEKPWSPKGGYLSPGHVSSLGLLSFLRFPPTLNFLSSFTVSLPKLPHPHPYTCSQFKLSGHCPGHVCKKSEAFEEANSCAKKSCPCNLCGPWGCAICYGFAGQKSPLPVIRNRTHKLPLRFRQALPLGLEHVLLQVQAEVPLGEV
ncbi:Arachidonate 12-lipoxygenase, epidermal-type [Varanus komodoensis]|nr:Arachidonate 12-lipoxygenase, epidermal-type [Varanus komodoensis]